MHLPPMARVHPFRAVRYASLEQAGRFLLPEGGRIPEGERRALAAAEDRHVGHLYEAPDPWATLRRWKKEGTVVTEDPAMYVVQMQPASRLDRTPAVRYLLAQMDADDRLPEMEQVRGRIATAPLGPTPVLAADDHQVLRGLLLEVAEENFPVWEAEVDGHLARLWRVGSGPKARRIRGVVDEVLARPVGTLPQSGPFLAAVVPLSEPGLRLLPFHRGLRGVTTFEAQRFLTLVKDYARVYELEQALTTPGGLEAAREQLATLAAGHHAVLLVLPGGRGALLRFRQALELTHIPAVPRSPTLRSLDLALLNALVLKTVLGIDDPEAPDHRQVFAVASLRDLVEKVEGGVFQAGFGLNPPPPWELRAVMEAQQAVPPHTLRLSPVPPAGLLFLDPEGRA
jgi:hypothetical protein